MKTSGKTTYRDVNVPAINIQFTLFSAFYTPLIGTMAGGFLRDEGLDYAWSVAPPGGSAIDALTDGTAQVVQSALSQGFAVLNRGEAPSVMHFAQINEMDGFFLTAREPDDAFDWRSLEGAEVVMFGGGQPLAMFKYACHRAGIDFARIKPVTPGGAAEIDAAFRAGTGAYVQQQGPYPQQLEAEGLGHVVAQVGRQVGRCGFSSLAATPEWLASDEASAFMRAYRRTRTWLNEADAAEVAEASLEHGFFPGLDAAVLTRCIAAYQALGCWTPHVEITETAYAATLDIYEYNGLVNERYPYQRVCVLPPE